jgi:O-antigen/teichoic acid export membrane protein
MLAAGEAPDAVASFVHHEQARRLDGGDPSAAALAGWERSKIGDRLACFGVLLPAHADGLVVIAAGAKVADVLQERYLQVIVLDLPAVDSARALPAQGGSRLRVRWDGVHSPLRDGSATMVIADSRQISVKALLPALAPGAQLAVLGRRGRYVLYPNAEHPEQIWRSGWPTPDMQHPIAQVKRAVGIRTSRLRAAPRLALRGPRAESLADLIRADLERRLGRSFRLVGIRTAGHTILHLSSRGGDVAVRLSMAVPGCPINVEAEIRSRVPAVRPLILEELASGTAAGCPWVATPWLPRGRRRISDLWRGKRRRWATADQLVEALQTVRTGHTGEGWSRRWCDQVTLLPSEAREHLSRTLRPLDAGVPTGWCHGDPWLANIVLDRDRVGVIDWENGGSDGPLGIDWLLVAALRATSEGRGTLADSCIRMIDAPTAIDRPVAGRLWSEWDRQHRTALAVAAFLLYLRNRSLHDLGDRQLAAELARVLAATGYDDKGRTDHADDESGGIDPLPLGNAARGAGSASQAMAGRAARGALWMGMSSLVVKGAQTVVLLLLAALLAPSALGIVAIGTLIMNIAAVLTDLGTSTALVYWRGDARRAARTALTIALTANLAVTAAIWIAAPWLVRVLHAPPDGVGVIRGLISVLPCLAVAGISYELLRRDLAFVRRIIPDIVGALAGAAVAVVLALQHHGVAALVVGQIVQGVLSMVLAWTVRPPVRPGWSRADARGLLRYGGHLTAGNLLQLVLLNADYLMVARVLGEGPLAQYSLAYRLAYLPYLNIVFVIAGAAFPYLCRLEGADVGQAFERIVTLSMAALVPMCVGIALFADQLELLGTKWAPAVPVVRWLALYAVLLSLSQLAQTALNSVGRPQATFQLRLLHLFTLLALLIVVVRHGIVPVAIAQVVAVTLSTAAAVVLVRSQVPGFVARRVVARMGPTVLGAAAMAATALTLQRAFPDLLVSARGLAVIGATSLIAYAMPVWGLDRHRVGGTVRLIARRA